MTNKFLFFFALVAILLNACNQTTVDDLTDVDASNNVSFAIVDSTLGFPVTIQDSTLYFAKADDMMEAMQVLKNLPSNQRRSWEKSVGFVSVQTILEDLNSKIETLKDEDEFKSLVLANKNFIKESETGSNGVKSRVYGFYPYVSSQRGFFVCDSIWSRVFDGTMYTTHYFDHEGYFAMSDLINGVDLGDTGVKKFTLDFNKEEELAFKAYTNIHTTSPTQILIWMYNYGYNEPTKRSLFTMDIINSYGPNRTLSSLQTITNHYFYIGYNGNCCTPSQYVYYYAPFGGLQRFEEYGSGWRIRVPYEGYFDSHPFAMTPNWDVEDYFMLTDEIEWYNYLGRADLQARFQAQKRNMWQKWVAWDGTVVYMKDVYAQFKVGYDVAGHSTAKTPSIGPLGQNYIEMKENGIAKFDAVIYKDILTEYNMFAPPVVFNKCVSGTLYSQFCPEMCNFSIAY